MIKVYVAGPFDADNEVDLLTNIRNGIRTSVEVFLKGYAPFCPWLDHQFLFFLREKEEIKREQICEYTKTWLKVSDAILVLPNSENSKGTKDEIKTAKDLNIPIFYNILDLDKHFKE